MIDRPIGRDLNGAELRRLAAELGARPWLWRKLVRHDAEQRTYASLIEDEHVSAWLVCWMPGHDTGFHDHDRSAAAINVVRGKLREERLVVDGPPAHATYLPGSTVEVEPHDIHRVLHGGGGPAISIHVYSPALVASGAYVIDTSGRLQRFAQSSGEELRPLVTA